MPGVHKRAAYEYLLDKYGEDNIGTYNNFKYYTWKRDMKPQKLSSLMLDMKQNQGNNCR